MKHIKYFLVGLAGISISAVICLIGAVIIRGLYKLLISLIGSVDNLGYVVIGIVLVTVCYVLGEGLIGEN